MGGSGVVVASPAGKIMSRSNSTTRYPPRKQQRQPPSTASTSNSNRRFQGKTKRERSATPRHVRYLWGCILPESFIDFVNSHWALEGRRWGLGIHVQGGVAWSQVASELRCTQTREETCETNRGITIVALASSVNYTRVARTHHQSCIQKSILFLASIPCAPPPQDTHPFTHCGAGTP